MRDRGMKCFSLDIKYFFMTTLLITGICTGSFIIHRHRISIHEENNCKIKHKIRKKILQFSMERY